MVHCIIVRCRAESLFGNDVRVDRRRRIERFDWSIRCAWMRSRRDAVSRACQTAIEASNGTPKNYHYKTMAYWLIPITTACYLCNTRRKTGADRPFRAVPLLRVHGPSVIVLWRRRGASRGRPVLGGSLKSAYANEEPLISFVFSTAVLSALYDGSYGQQLGGLT